MKLVCFNVSIHEDNGEKVIEFLRKGDEYDSQKERSSICPCIV